MHLPLKQRLKGQPPSSLTFPLKPEKLGIIPLSYILLRVDAGNAGGAGITFKSR